MNVFDVKKQQIENMICPGGSWDPLRFSLESEEIRRWYTVLSCCVQRANAKVLRGDAVPGRSSRVPDRLLSGRYDLAVCGA